MSVRAIVPFLCMALAVAGGGAAQAGVGERTLRESLGGRAGVAGRAPYDVDSLGAEHMDSPLAHVPGDEMGDAGARKDRATPDLQPQPSVEGIAASLFSDPSADTANTRNSLQ